MASWSDYLNQMRDGEVIGSNNADSSCRGKLLGLPATDHKILAGVAGVTRFAYRNCGF